jgi:hypothetical protein
LHGAFHGELFSNSSNWADPDNFSALRSTLEDRPKQAEEFGSAKVELAARVQLHLGEKALLLLRRIADDAPTTARAVVDSTG